MFFLFLLRVNIAWPLRVDVDNEKIPDFEIDLTIYSVGRYPGLL